MELFWPTVVLLPTYSDLYFVRIKRILFLFFLFRFLSADAQDSLAYGSGFKFKDGIYLNYQQFRNNKPIPRAKLISNVDTSRLDYIRLLANTKSIHYKDSTGKEQEISPNKLWGFCENSSVYIRFNGDFNKVMVMGTICHFTAMQTTYMNTGPTMGGPNTGTPVTSMQQYILDTKTGAVMDYTLPNLELILKRDPVLYAEFTGLRKGKRKKMMFLYLRKYNEKVVLKFPS
jgi:hypothetical protein